MNFYKRHIGDYIKDAGHLKLLEHGVYARLMDVYYTRESGIPDDKAARLIGASTRQELDALKIVLDEFFDLVDGMWIQKRCEEEIAVANAKADKNRENGKSGGRPKRKVTEEEPKKNPDGFDSVSEKNLSQTPDSRLQTPEENQESLVQASTSVAPKPSARSAEKNATRLPADWVPTDEDAIFCERERRDLRVAEVAARFRDYWVAQPGAKGRKTDWAATWRNWVRNEKPPGRPIAAPYQTANDKARAWADNLTGKTRREQPSTIIDITPTLFVD